MMSKLRYISLLAILAFLPQINGAPINLSIYGEEEEEQSALIHDVDSLSDASSDEALPLLTRAEEVVVDTVDISLSRDTVITDSLSDVSSDDPDWYIPAVIPEELRAPQRATASTCLTDSILTFNADSILTEATIYDYDAAGRTIRTTIWKYDVNGGILGTSSKTEYCFDSRGSQIYAGTFAWDTNTNDWRGTSKTEFVYNEAHKMESNITYTWVNNTWLPSQALTYAYDAAGRETEFTTYSRNASVNHLVPSKQRLQTWYNASKKTLEINYTAYTNGAWSAGNKKEYDYDAKGNQIEYTYYSSYSNGNWVGSTQEFWIYNSSSKKTNYEKYTWSNGSWLKNTKEIFDYDAAGNNTFYEKYTGSGNQWNGSKKEDYEYNSAKKKIRTIVYKWTGSGWEYNTKTETPYDSYGNRNENTKYTYRNNLWTGSGTRTVTFYNSSKQVTERSTYTWGTTDWVNATKEEYAYSGSNTTMEANYTWSVEDNAWIGGTKHDRSYNAADQNDTTRTYIWGTNGWVFDFRTVNTFDAAGNLVMGHSSAWNGTRWVMTAMTRTDYASDAAGRVTLTAEWHCGADSIWIGENMVTYEYDTHGNTSLTSNYVWSVYTNDWQLSAQSRYDAGYDAANHLILSASYIKDLSDNSWRGTDKYEYTYDSNNNQTYQAHLNWLGGQWTYDWKMEMTYDAQNRLTLESRSSYSNGAWIGNYRYEYSYNTAGQQIKNIMYKWSVSHNTWEGLTYYEYAYSGAQKILDVTYRWDYTLWRWMGSFKYEYAFDAQNREIMHIYMLYDDAADDWVNSIKTELAYNIRGLNNRTEEFEWLNGSWSPTSLTERIFDDADNKIRRETTGTWTAGVVSAYTDKHYFYSCDAPASNGSQPRTPTDIEEIDENNESNVQPFDPTQPTYNLSGQRVDPAIYHGVVIQGGKTYLIP